VGGEGVNNAQVCVSTSTCRHNYIKKMLVTLTVKGTKNPHIEIFHDKFLFYF
jgi:hypothetical protein